MSTIDFCSTCRLRSSFCMTILNPQGVSHPYKFLCSTMIYLHVSELFDIISTLKSTSLILNCTPDIQVFPDCFSGVDYLNHHKSSCISSCLFSLLCFSLEHENLHSAFWKHALFSVIPCLDHLTVFYSTPSISFGDKDKNDHPPPLNEVFTSIQSSFFSTEN